MPTDNALRQRVLGEHAILRALIERLRTTAQAATRGGLAQELRDAGRTLHAVLEAHCRVEEELIGPLLVPSRDPGLLRDVHDHHRRALAALERLRGRGTEKYARAILRLAPRLLAAIDAEERDLFRAAPVQTHGRQAI